MNTVSSNECGVFAPCHRCKRDRPINQLICDAEYEEEDDATISTMRYCVGGCEGVANTAVDDDPEYEYCSTNKIDRVIIEAVDKTHFSVCSEYDRYASTVFLPVEEIDKMIAGLQAIKSKLTGAHPTIPSMRQPYDCQSF